jgi:hypothetical protein
VNEFSENIAFTDATYIKLFPLPMLVKPVNAMIAEDRGCYLVD